MLQSWNLQFDSVTMDFASHKRHVRSNPLKPQRLPASTLWTYLTEGILSLATTAVKQTLEFQYYRLVAIDTDSPLRTEAVMAQTPATTIGRQRQMPNIFP